MQMMNKFEIEAKMAREKKETERRKNILIIILRYLINVGLSESAFKLQEEASIDLEKYDVADNIDLYVILCEYEEYFELRFNRKVKLSKLVEDGGNSNNKLPNINKTYNVNNDRKTPKLQSKQSKTSNIKKESIKDGKENNNKEINNLNDFVLVGKGVDMNKKVNEQPKEEKYDFNEQKESILLKPFPEHLFGNTELKELAALVKR